MKRTGCLLALLGLAMSASGCYRHVVGARGFGTEGVTIHEANLQDEAQSESTSRPVSRGMTPDELNRNAVRP